MLTITLRNTALRGNIITHWFSWSCFSGRRSHRLKKKIEVYANPFQLAFAEEYLLKHAKARAFRRNSISKNHSLRFLC